MIAVHLLSREQVEHVLGAYGCTYIKGGFPGLELWETGWGVPFTLQPNEDGRYDEWQIRRFVTFTIATTMPFDWFDGRA
jgi:hypothetical protein